MNYENVKLQSTNYKNVLKTHFWNIRTVRLTFSMEDKFQIFSFHIGNNFVLNLFPLALKIPNAIANCKNS